MDDEYFDVVDEQERLTGEHVSRKEAHAKGIWHRTVHLYLFRRIGKDFAFLVNLRAKTKDANPNRWATIFGGHVLSGDSLEETARRELQEEAGLNLDDYTVIEGNVRKSTIFPNNEFVHYFFVEIPGDVRLQFNDGEVQQAEWMTSKEIIHSMKKSTKPWASRLVGFQEALQLLQSRWRD